MRLTRSFLILASVCCLVSCGERSSVERRTSDVSQPATSSEPQTAVVFASNYPLAYFAERILGSDDLVHFPVIDGDPAFWEPSVEDIERMQDAAVILLNGATYEKWRETVSLPSRRLVDTSEPFRDEYIHIEDAPAHSHGPGEEHAHAGTSFTTWLDPTLAIRQADAVHVALVQTGRFDEAELASNLERLAADLEAMDVALTAITEQASDSRLVASHPVYQYLARRYGLDIENVMWEPDVFPGREQWEVLADLIERHPARWMIWEGQPLAESVSRLEEMGVQSIVYDPAGNRPTEGDFMSVMRANIDQLRTALGQ